ncbi:hypothetical protein GCM10011482_03760 [Enterococcus alcedinis]|uniref:Uncharacterized protein n=1 Tax=Enterococcus alcedinis TaxID=1274384 RepID=A0A917JEP3_9ENTE|nr:PcfJ domain-containing protein [Enterococcus alcedinis]MBP2100980.1 hypothetical protein [Enterococcus alcedinis]GGI64722.1 hypothetical protein GCM10011482_03760 [Enterococcus alcedinis]
MIKTANDYANNKLKVPKAFFEWAYCQMPTYEWRNKEKSIIASTRKHSYCTTKKLVKNSRLTFFDKSRLFVIVLSTSKRIEIQTWNVASFFENGKQVYKDRLINLEVLAEGAHIKLSQSDDNNFRFGLKPTVGLFSYYQPEVYENRWHDRLHRVSELKYIELPFLYVEDIPRVYKYRKQIEYAQKINAMHLANDIANNNNEIDMRIVTKNWLKKFKPFFKNTQYGYKEYLLKQALEKVGSRFIPGIEKYMAYKDVSKIPRSVKINKLQKYLIKQKTDFSYYRDYLKLLKDLKTTKENIVYFPTDIVQAHDKAVDTLNATKRELVQEGFVARAEELKALEMVIGDYSFILPKCADDLVKEGQALRHCVSSSGYIGEHVAGKTTIIFARKREEPEKSFFTIEYRKKRIQQIQGNRNREHVPDDLQKVVDIWLRTANKIVC